MTDERMLAAFRAFDLPLEPDAEFGERLFAMLAEGIEWGTMPDPSLRGRLRRALGLGVLPTGRRALRLAYLVAMLGLLLALAWGAVFIASHLRTAPTPAELVRLSQQVYEHPPAFSVTYRMPMSGDQTLSADGSGTWRVEQADDAQGTYWLWDGATRVGYFDPQTLTWRAGTSTELGVMAPPGPLFMEHTWGTGEATAEDPGRHVIACGGAQTLAEATILGRVTDHIRCTDIDMQYWLDRESHLILRMEAGPATPHWSGQTGLSAVVVEATSFSLGPQAAAAFDWAGPPRAYSPSNAPASIRLQVGDPLPEWQGTMLDGGKLDTASVTGPALYLIIATGCDQCIAQWDAVSASVRTHPALRGVIVANDQTGTLTGFVGLHPTTMSVVADPAGTLLTAWGINSIPALVAVGPDGRIAGVVAGPNSTEDLGRLVEAAAAGAPIPSIGRLPGASPTPCEATPSPSGRILEPVSEYRLTSLAFGSLMPSWGGPQPGGGRFDGSSLLGQPSVIWFSGWIGCASCQQDALDSFASDAARIGDRVHMVIVASAEPTPGWLAKRFETHGFTVPIVYDWDGRVRKPFDLRFDDVALVFDASGRLVDERSWPPALPELEAIADAFGSPNRSPGPSASR